MTSGPTGDETAGSKILVVDDDEDITQLLRHQLEAEGYRVLAAQHEEDVLQLARQEQPDLITLDILLDGVDGFDVLAKLKQDSMTAEILSSSFRLCPTLRHGAWRWERPVTSASLLKSARF